MDDYQLQAVVYSCLAVVVGVYVVRWYNDPLRAIPTVGGSSLPGLSYISAFCTLRRCRDVLQEGYRKYPDSAFRVAGLDKWTVIVSGRSMVEELRRRGDEELSSPEGARETLKTTYTLEPAVLTDAYQVDVIRETFTRRLPTVLPDIIDEISVAVKDNIVATEDEWTSVEITRTLQTIIARASNRAFVGLPLCRNDEYLALAIHFAVGLFKSSVILGLLPRFLKPLVARLINPLYATGDTHRAVAHLRPIIEERQKAMAELGEGWNDKPNDLLQLLLDKAATRNETMFLIAQRVLVVNFAAIHTSSMTLSHALYDLAEKPELIAALREEIETVVAENGWTSVALGKMWKLDSFLRESLRYRGLSFWSMNRLAMKDLVLPDGTRIPQGTHVAAPSYAIHHDGALLADARAFDPFRFARMRTEGAAASARHQFTSTSPEYLPFGHGPHACPGRYFASSELKAVLAYLLLNYDVKLGGDGVRPPEVHFAMRITPPSRGRVLFRKRKHSSEGPV